MFYVNDRLWTDVDRQSLLYWRDDDDGFWLSKAAVILTFQRQMGDKADLDADLGLLRGHTKNDADLLLARFWNFVKSARRFASTGTL